jgi:hypothetical protein
MKMHLTGTVAESDWKEESDSEIAHAASQFVIVFLPLE